MGSKKKLKKSIKDLANPQILTLDEALALKDETPDPEESFCNQDPHGRVVDAVLDRIGSRFSGLHNIDVLTHGERLVLEVTILMGEVLNGGFHQYLSNSSGDHGEKTKSMLGEIGASLTRELLERVSGFFPDGHIPEDRKERWRLIEEFEDAHPEVELFRQEDRAFYKGDENLYALLVQYIADHRIEFAEPADAIVRKFKRREKIWEHLGVMEDSAALEEAEEALRAIEAQFDVIQEEFRKEQLGMIKELLAAGQKREAIKAYRSIFECSLSDAKAAVEAMDKLS